MIQFNMTTLFSKQSHINVRDVSSWTIKELTSYVRNAKEVEWHPHFISLMFKDGFIPDFFKKLPSVGSKDIFYSAKVLAHPEWNAYVNESLDLIGDYYSIEDFLSGLNFFVTEELLFSSLMDQAIHNKKLQNVLVNYLLDTYSNNNDIIGLMDEHQKRTLIQWAFEAADVTNDKHRAILHLLADNYHEGLIHWLQYPELKDNNQLFTSYRDFHAYILSIPYQPKKETIDTFYDIKDYPHLIPVHALTQEQRLYLFVSTLHEHMYHNSIFLGNVITFLSDYYIADCPNIKEELMNIWQSNIDLSPLYDYLRNPLFFAYDKIFEASVVEQKATLKSLGMNDASVETKIQIHFVTLVKEAMNPVQECHLHV